MDMSDNMATSIKSAMKHAIIDYFKGDTDKELLFGQSIWWSMVERFSLQQLEYIMSDGKLLYAYIDKVWNDLQDTPFNDVRY